MPNPFKRRLSSQDIPGFAGGSLQDLLDEQDPQQKWHPPMVAPPEGQKQSPVIPEPRSAVQQPVAAPAQSAASGVQDIGAPPAWTRPTYDPTTGKPSRGIESDPVKASSEYYNALEQWKPRGAKRGFKNSLKAGAMMASEAVRNNPDNPVAAAIAGFGVGAAGATAAPNFKNRLTREWELKKTGGQLKNQLGLQKEQAQIDVLQSKPQQAADAEGDRAMQRYNSLEHYDPDDPADAGVKAYLESRGLRGLPARDKYHPVKVTRTGDGRILVTDQDGTVDMTVGGQVVGDAARKLNSKGLNPNQQAITDRDSANRISREQVSRLGRQTRVAEGQKNRDAAMARTQVLVAAGGLKMGDPGEFESLAQENVGHANDLDAQAEELAQGGHPTAATALRKLALEARQDAIKLKEMGIKARSAQSAVSPSPASRGRRGNAVKPAQDGKYHYTLDQIKARSDAEGASYEEVLKRLRADSRVVID